MSVNQVAQAFSLCALLSKRGARPGPFRRCVCKTSCHGIVFDIANSLPKFLAGSYPTIPGFVLPKRRADQAECRIRETRGRALQPLCDPAQWNIRGDQDVYMIRHNHPRVEIVESLSGAELDPICHKRCDARISKPPRSRRGVQLPVLDDKRDSGVRTGDQRFSASRDRNRAKQAPGDEDWNAFRLKVRKGSTILHILHIGANRASFLGNLHRLKACATW